MGCKIGIISDIHFGKFSKTDELTVPGEVRQDRTEGAKPLFSGAKDILKGHNLDYLFVAGDLTSIASPQEYYYCELKLLELADSLKINKDKIIFCTGNHDVDYSITELSKHYESTTTEVFEIIKKKYQQIAASTATHVFEIISSPTEGVASFSGIVDSPEFIVFVLNSSLFCGPEQSLPHGKLGKTQYNWIEDKLNYYHSDKRNKIILMHHHPIVYTYPIPEWDTSAIEEGSSLAALAGNLDVSLIIHGHRHHPIVKTVKENSWNNEVTFLCAGSMSVNSNHLSNGDIPNTMHVLEFLDDRGTYKLYNYEYNGVEGWVPTKYRPAVPLDDEMYIGKIIDRSQASEMVKKWEDVKDPINWTDLDEDLRYWGYNEVTQLFKKIMSPKHSVIGEFPEPIVLLEV